MRRETRECLRVVQGLGSATNHADRRIIEPAQQASDSARRRHHVGADEDDQVMAGGGKADVDRARLALATLLLEHRDARLGTSNRAGDLRRLIRAAARDDNDLRDTRISLLQDSV
jgi:hypothetical protein